MMSVALVLPMTCAVWCLHASETCAVWTVDKTARFKDVQAVYGVLKEAEHRSTFYIPYWNIPITRYIVPRQRKFRADLEVINDCLDGLIARAKQTRQADDVEALQARDYSKAC